MRVITFVMSLLLIFAIPWEGVVKLPGIGTMARLLGFAMAGCWLLAVIISGKVRKPVPFQLVVALFVLWNGLSVFWSTSPERTLLHLVTWAQLLILVFILWDLYTTRESILLALQVYIFGEYVAVSSAVFNFLTGRVYYVNHQRFSAGETNPDGFGFLLAVGIPIAWYLAGSEKFAKHGILFKFINYAYIPVAFFGLALSGTRAALIASLVGMAFGLASLTRLRLRTRIAIFVLLTAVILYLLPTVQSLASFQRLGTTASELASGELNQRSFIWREGWRSFIEHPLLGVGGNMYRSVNRLGKVAHNTFISVLVELGLVGLVLFITILAMATVHALSQPKWDAIFWLSLLAVWGVGALSLTYEHRKATWLIFSLIVASAALNVPRTKAATAFVRPKRSREALVTAQQLNLSSDATD